MNTPSTSPSVCRWGILGTAGIARKNWKAIRLASNATLVAVASRSTERAAQFIDECSRQVPFPATPASVGRYDDLLQRSDVDAVYIPLPTGIRPEWVIRAAEAGKHVLCEKPCAVDAATLRRMLDACTAAGVQFMDGVMFMHSRRLPSLRAVLDDAQTVGQIQRIATQFSFRADDAFLQQNIRTSRELEPLGCLGDLGWYNIRFTLWAMGYAQPTAVTGRLLTAHGTGVPLQFSAELFFPQDVSASFYCSFLTEHQQWAVISGTRGYVHLSDFVLPFFGSEVGYRVTNSNFLISGCDFHMEPGTRDIRLREYADGAATAQETNMIGHFSDLVLRGKRESQWPAIALQTQQVLDACLQSARSGGELVALAT